MAGRFRQDGPSGSSPSASSSSSSHQPSPQFGGYPPAASFDFNRPLLGGFDGPGDGRHPITSGHPPNTQQMGATQPSSQSLTALNPRSNSQVASRQISRRPSLTDMNSHAVAARGLPSSQQQHTPASSQAPSFPAPLGRDPAKLESPITNTRVELPADAYRMAVNALVGPGVPQNHGQLVKRPGFNKSGKPIQVRVNQFKVTQIPATAVWQYDILIGNGAEARGLNMKAWNSDEVKAAREKHSPIWLWDGNKIAWASHGPNNNKEDIRITVNLDKDKIRPLKAGATPQTTRVVLRATKQINMAVLTYYLDGKIQFDNSVLEAINFCDHLLRQWPTELYAAQKRSFFNRGGQRTALDTVIEAMKGCYSSIRLCNSPVDNAGNKVQGNTGLAVNVDVANGTFWTAQDVCQAARNLCKTGNPRMDYNTFRDQLKPRIDPKNPNCCAPSDAFRMMEKMKKLRFKISYQNKGNTPYFDPKKVYTIKCFSFNKNIKFLQTGLNAFNHGFVVKVSDLFPANDPLRNKNGEISIFDYYKKKYGKTLNYPYLPLIETEKNGMFPMELATLLPNQKYNFKLDPVQTAAMIKFAVTRPPARLQSIKTGIGMLKWDEDPYLKHFGCKISNQLTLTNCRLLQNPEVEFFKGTKLNPGTTGRWDLRGKKFFQPNDIPLKSWCVVVLQGCVTEAVVNNFMTTFVNTYIGHGGKVETKLPPVYHQHQGEDLNVLVHNARNATGTKFQMQPQVMLYILPGRNSTEYERLKKNNECRFGMFSQMMNVAHVIKGQPQYCSNVCMKLNAKLGGTTSKIPDAKGSIKPFFTAPTIVMGADVSHSSPGSKLPSTAAITMSLDKHAARYAAAVDTNGYRVEMIEDTVFENKWLEMYIHWNSLHKVHPQHIYYFRDGVSEGQFQQVIDSEIACMKRLLLAKFNQAPKFTVVVCTKRHHLRFFPNEKDMVAGDRNGNALPGTLVERDITHPYEFDFYLNSHSAIQGTARPTHYQVIHDEIKIDTDLFQRMVYQHCYQYMRSTTPVSLYPAVYYAHLASNRAKCHEPTPASDGAKGGQKFEEARADAANQRTILAGTGKQATSVTGSSILPDIIPLLPMGNASNEFMKQMMIRIRNGMWYI